MNDASTGMAQQANPEGQPMPPEEDQGQNPAQSDTGADAQVAPDAVDAVNTEQQDSQIDGRLYATAKQVMRLPKAQQDTVLASLPRATQQQIVEIMSALESDQKRERNTQVDMRPYPEQRPPRRAGY